MDNSVKSIVSSPSLLEFPSNAKGTSEALLGRGSRIRSLDIARGFTVLIMPSIHVVMMYSTPEVQQSWLGIILEFIAEGPGAQLFMLVMGIALVIGKKQTGVQVLKRSLTFLLAAYALNIVKLVIPYGLGLVPDNLIHEIGLTTDAQALKFFIFFGDILHFAAIAYPLLWCVSRIRHYQYIVWIMALGIATGSPLIWDTYTGIGSIDYVLNLFVGHPPQTFFPVFPWLVYPLVGMGIGYRLKHRSVLPVMKQLRWWGFMIIGVTISLPPTKSSCDWLPFYRTAPVDTFFHVGLVFLWLGYIDWLYRKVRESRGFALLEYCSKHITVIYLVQWILICWGMAVTGYMQLGMKATLYAMMIVTMTTLFFTWLFRKGYGK